MSAEQTARQIAELLQQAGIEKCVDVFRSLLVRLGELDASFTVAVLPELEVALVEYWEAAK